MMRDEPYYDVNVVFALYEQQDYAQLMDYVKPFAEAGLSDAQCELGTMYQCGTGVTGDLSQAEYWLVKAASQNNSVAWNNLGTLYALNNPSKSKQCYKRAVELGFTPA